MLALLVVPLANHKTNMRKLGFNLSGQHEDDTAIEEELQRYLSLLGVNGRLERSALLDEIRK